MTSRSPSTPPHAARILLIANTFPPIHGGSAVVYGGLCEHLPKGSIRVLTAARSHTDNQAIPGAADHDRQCGYSVTRIPLLRPVMLPPSTSVWESLRRLLLIDLPLNLQIFWAAYREVKRHDINVVCMGELVSGGWLGLALKRWLGCRLLFYIHGEEVTTHTAGRLSGDRRQHYLAAADQVISVSSFTAAALEREMKVAPEKITLIPNGVDTARFTPGPANPALLATWQISDQPVVLTVGRLVPRKGIDMAIQAMALVVAKHPDAQHLIVGDGPYRRELEQLIVQLGLQRNVRLLGALPFHQVLDLFRSCQVFLMPNRTMPDGDTEGFGLVFREANACGKPAIGGRAGGAVDAIDDGDTGYLVDGHNAADIAQKVIQLLDEPALASRMGSQGLEAARRNDVKAVAARFLQACQALV